MRWTFAMALMAGLIVAGCEAPSSSAPEPAARQQAGNSARPKPPLPPAPAQGAAAGQKPDDGATAATDTPEAAPGTGREKAVVGVGKRGRDYGGGMITTPVSVYFRGPQMMAFRIQIPENMKLYRAMNGHYPKSQEEFMQKIIKDGMIKLPELPEGKRYVYDAKKAAEMHEYDPEDPPLYVEDAK